MKKLVAVICCFFMVMCQCVLICADKTDEQEKLLNLHAISAVLMDGDSGRLLYNYQGDHRLPMASTTKIMTCIIALEHDVQEEFAVVSSKAQSMPKVHLSVKKGEYYRISDLLYSLMLESHNDSAVVIAEHIGGSVEGFAELMNQKAEEIGCQNTSFVTPNGLDADNHYTTARELGMMMRYCIQISDKKDAFLEITRTASYSFSNYEKEGDDMKSGGRSFTVNNKNAFLSMMDGALSGKTGFTSKAGYCYVGALKRDGKCLIVALLGCGWPGNRSWKWEDTKKLMEYGLTHFEYRNWFEPPVLPVLPVHNAKSNMQTRKTAKEWMEEIIEPKGKMRLSIKEDGLTEGMLLRDTDRITMQMTIPESLTAPVAGGEVVGEVSYYLNGGLLKSFSVVTMDTIAKTDFWWYLERLTGLYFWI